MKYFIKIFEKEKFSDRAIDTIKKECRQKKDEQAALLNAAAKNPNSPSRKVIGATDSDDVTSAISHRSKGSVISKNQSLHSGMSMNKRGGASSKCSSAFQ